MGQLIAAAAYSGGQRVADISINEGRSWAQKSTHFVWIGFHEPNESELREIQAQFELHPLAIEDALHAHQRPKLELYGDSLFLVLRTAQLQGDHVAFGETHIFAGQGFVISIRHGPSASYAPVRTRCCYVTGRITSSTPPVEAPTMIRSASLARSMIAGTP